MSRVLVFGTFDLLHPGHLFTLRKARDFGDSLTVVVALDETVKQVKGFFPEHDQQQRMTALIASGLVEEAVLGKTGDKYAVIEQIDPDVIVLGYDQKAFVDKLESELGKRGLDIEVIRITESFEPEKYKSSILRKK